MSTHAFSLTGARIPVKSRARLPISLNFAALQRYSGATFPECRDAAN
jgi:hypothetical protein